jgi:dynein heavy chain
MHSVNVSTIIGPPYAIKSLKPQLGPLTGKTKIIITGDGFKDSQNIIVRFAIGKFAEEVAGNFINENELWCETPSYEKHGARKVEVRVSINK